LVIKAIPTTYRNIEYRSKLEANWAEWLYNHGFNTQYEKRKFKLERNIWYLPDFYIPETKTFIEVKGNLERLHKPFQLVQELKRECPETWPDGGTMLLLAGPKIGAFYNIEQPYYMGLKVIHCKNCNVSSIITEYGSQKCRYCGSKDWNSTEPIPVSQKPLKWLLLERD